MSSLFSHPDTMDPEGNITPSVGYRTSDRPSIVTQGEFLFWTADVGNLSYGLKSAVQSRNSSVNPNQTGLVDKKKEEFNWGWDPGVRAKLGVISDYDGWDFLSSWTYFYTSETTSKTVEPFHSNDFGNVNNNPIGTEVFSSSWFVFNDQTRFNKLKAKASILFNQIDLNQGRNFWISDYLSIRPFMGVRGYWTRLYFHLNGSRSIGSDIGAADAMARAKQNSWAVGLLSGLNTDWHLGCGFSLFGEFDFALAYGRTRVHLKRTFFEENNASTQIDRNVTGRTKDSFYQIHPFCDLGIGLRYNHDFDKTLRLILDAGWEYHTILKFNQFFKSTSREEGFTDLPSQRGNLSMTGLVIRGRVEF